MFGCVRVTDFSKKVTDRANKECKQQQQQQQKNENENENENENARMSLLALGQNKITSKTLTHRQRIYLWRNAPGYMSCQLQDLQVQGVWLVTEHDYSYESPETAYYIVFIKSMDDSANTHRCLKRKK